jgi:hypothetical protein
MGREMKNIPTSDSRAEEMASEYETMMRETRRRKLIMLML